MRDQRHARRYSFAGDTVSVFELARWIPVYNERRLEQALRAGCDSIKAVMMWLSQRDYEAGRRHAQGSNKGIAAQRLVHEAGVTRARAGR